MTVSTAAISKAQVTELISRLDHDKLSANEAEVLQQWMTISSVVWSSVADEKLLCLWGLIPPTFLSDQAYLWLHVAEAAYEHEFVLVRRSQIEVKKMLVMYPRIVGHCEVGEARSIRWLRWLGATFGEPDGKLIPFVIRGMNG